MVDSDSESDSDDDVAEVVRAEPSFSHANNSYIMSYVPRAVKKAVIKGQCVHLFKLLPGYRAATGMLLNPKSKVLKSVGDDREEKLEKRACP